MTQSGATGASPDLVNAFLQRLAKAQELTGIETTTQMAELLWLATHLESDFPSPESPGDQSEDIDVSQDDEGSRRLTPSTGRSPSTSSPEHPSSKRIDIVAPTPQKALPPEVLPVQIVDPAMLSDPLAIIRALKPLLQKIDAGTGSRLDESATVDFIARTQLCVPKLQPDQETWFDIILVVDRSSASMVIWQRLVQDIVRALRRYGAFRDVRVFDLVIYPEAQPADQVMLRSHPQRPDHHPKELIDQTGRRLAIVLSDSTGAHWWQGILTPTLETWGHHMPVVLWQMLPPWMWQRTALGRGIPVSLRNDLPGGTNQRLKKRAPAQNTPASLQQRIALPVVTGEERDLSRWSQLVAGKPGVTPGFLLPPPGGTVPRSSSVETLADVELAERRVERFLRLSSPDAQWLLMLLAAAPVITLPIVRLIREEKLPDVRSPLPIAEVFTGGLLQRLPGQEERALESTSTKPEQSDELIEPQDLVQYDFAGRVRGVLLSGKWLPPVDAVDVINSVSRAITRRFNRLYPYTFQAYLKDPNIELPEGLEGAKTFATITADILASLGRPYEDLVQQLRRGAAKVPVPVTELDPYGRRLQTFEYEVAEYLNLPPLESFEFVDAQLIDDDFPPSLDTEDFTIITLEPQTSSRPVLQPFEFVLAKLIPSQDTNEWVIERQQRQANRFTEPLANDIYLKMVAIPGGTFLMGSPESEPGHYDRESPQHEVAVQPFFMSRYPVTQVQWRAVAALPQVERELNLNPSGFNGENRPVEQVSWDDAVEFCDRLSAHTGRQYRLPTEAEWEYACRAGTTTPFHFSDMITTEVANYNGSAYADGPKGESRGETTPVDHFEIANAFGLSDMHGNVWEWCQDDWHNTYEGAPIDGSAWVTGGNTEYKIRRGGSWFDNPRHCRSAYRIRLNPDNRDVNVGFRVCCSAPRSLQ
ncbi:formylglycine-generating enzyme family protein [Sphaerothrix gracilis]|uniref:formylglycine-generating enzyme family protein n=1 Tax=Sphaerothrix gracilis TaxID=3151835 RepID=UPI0031FC86CF